ncbi:response regulator transcription factor [Clostridiaceae bacterium HSG29]|nr:response regulator transcription factor [Clostridiaceae bacterium HSG29]
MANILVLEDQDEIREFIVINIKRENHDVFKAASGEEALEIVEKNNIDVAVLDIMLPGINGLEVCKNIRRNNKYMGIIMLTAKGLESDKEEGFMSGADDYIIKPFSPKELIMRINALLRRVDMLKNDTDVKYVEGPFTIDFDSRAMLKNDNEIELTQIEFSIISLMVKNKGKSLSREEILDAVWGENFFGSFKIVDVNIRRIRKKIEEDPSEPIYIKTIWGYGYRWSLDE